MLEARRSLNPGQEINLSLLRRLRDRSLGENSPFAHVMLSQRAGSVRRSFLDK